MSTATLNRPAVEPDGVVTRTNFDVSDTYVRVVPAAPDKVWQALSRRSPVDAAALTANALGVSDRLWLPPTALVSRPGAEAVFALVWRFDGRASAVDGDTSGSLTEPGYVRVIWSVEVQPIEAGSLLSLTVRFAATDEVTRARLLAAWQLIGPASASVAQRALATLKADAQEDDDDPAS